MSTAQNHAAGLDPVADLEARLQEAELRLKTSATYIEKAESELGRLEDETVTLRRQLELRRQLHERQAKSLRQQVGDQKRILFRLSREKREADERIVTLDAELATARADLAIVTDRQLVEKLVECVEAVADYYKQDDLEGSLAADSVLKDAVRLQEQLQVHHWARDGTPAQDSDLVTLEQEADKEARLSPGSKEYNARVQQEGLG